MDYLVLYCQISLIKMTQQRGPSLFPTYFPTTNRKEFSDLFGECQFDQFKKFSTKELQLRCL